MNIKEAIKSSSLFSSVSTTTRNISESQRSFTFAAHRKVKIAMRGKLDELQRAVRNQTGHEN